MIWCTVIRFSARHVLWKTTRPVFCRGLKDSSTSDVFPITKPTEQPTYTPNDPSNLPIKTSTPPSTFPVTKPTTGDRKDIIIYKYDKPRFYKVLNIFAIVQCFAFAFMGRIMIGNMKNIPVSPEEFANINLEWWRKRNFGDDLFKGILSLTCYACGFIALTGTWFYTMRSVRYLVLRKSLDKISVVTYTPFGENRIIDVPLEKMSCVSSRFAETASLPLKMAGYRFYFILDKRGEFRHPELFDRTAGVQRKL